jgi:hypothetical protein
MGIVLSSWLLFVSGLGQRLRVIRSWHVLFVHSRIVHSQPYCLYFCWARDYFHVKNHPEWGCVDLVVLSDDVISYLLPFVFLDHIILFDVSP